tara:strand:- start:5 stop:703 length:699 start_codon:yes stop_codon:yes gene_type:complete
MAEQYIIENVEALWPKIDKTYVFDQKVKRSVPCSPRDTGAEFSIAFRMDNDTAKALFTQMKAAYAANKEASWPEKLVNPFVKDDNGTFTHKAVLKGAYKGEVTDKPLQVDSQGTPLKEDFQLTTGSTVGIAVSFYPYDFGGKQSVSLRLKAVQVIKYIPKEVRNPFGAVEGGFVIEDPSPFKKSNNVLEAAPVDDDDDGFGEAPVKRTAKKADVAAPSGDGDLADIIDNWDD